MRQFIPGVVVSSMFMALVFSVSSLSAPGLPGKAVISGKVSAPVSIEAAQVYAKDVNRNIIYMSYTSAGQYRLVGMMDGNYELWVGKRGYDSGVQSLRLEQDTAATVDFTLQKTVPQPLEQGSFRGPANADKPVVLQTYDELYPPAPARDWIEQTCLNCHGYNFLSFKHMTEAEWRGAVTMMTQPRPGGTMIPEGTLTLEQIESIIAYLAMHFGTDTPDRALDINMEYPVDETVLKNAQYIEYLLPLDEKRPKRFTQETRIDAEGNVWYTERTLPNILGMLDPKTGVFTEHELPDPKADPHGLTIDSEGWVYVAETRGGHLSRFHPHTGKWERFPIDPEGKIGGRLAAHTPEVDSQENVWFTVIVGNRLGKWDRQTRKIQLWDVPTPGSAPYGLSIGSNDQIYLAELTGCKVAHFNPATEQFKEYSALDRPCIMRRLAADKGHYVWYGVFSQGKLGRIDTRTGAQLEYDMYSRFNEPYSVRMDPQQRPWMSEAGLGGALVQYHPDTGVFDYYPSPRRSDMPKFDISKDGQAIWYPVRALPDGAIGVLYPDITRVSK